MNMRYPTRRRLARSALSLALLVLSPAAGAAMYKWVDDQGQVHYGDTIPPEYAKQEQEKVQVDERGFEVKVIQERAMTPEERAEIERQRREEAERQRAIEEQERADRLLVRSYDSLDALQMARTGKLEAIDSQIRLAEGQIHEREELLERQHRKAAELERSGKPVNDKLLQAIETTEQQIAGNRERIAELEREKETVRAEYDAKIARYKKLKGIPE